MDSTGWQDYIYERKDDSENKTYHGRGGYHEGHGEYMQADGTFSPTFYNLIEEYERKFDEAASKTSLPDNPDMDRVEKFVERINRYKGQHYTDGECP